MNLLCRASEGALKWGVCLFGCSSNINNYSSKSVTSSVSVNNAKRIKRRRSPKYNMLATSVLVFSPGDHALSFLSFFFLFFPSLLLSVLILASNLTGSCGILFPIGFWPGSKVQAHRKAILARNWKEFIRVAVEWIETCLHSIHHSEHPPARPIALLLLIFFFPQLMKDWSPTFALRLLALTPRSLWIYF